MNTFGKVLIAVGSVIFGVAYLWCLYALGIDIVHAFVNGTPEKALPQAFLLGGQLWLLGYAIVQVWKR